MKSIGIFGAGIFGLYAAIKFKLKGINDVTVIDPNHGVYTRPGIINYDIFDAVSESLSIDDFAKDAESEPQAVLEEKEIKQGESVGNADDDESHKPREFKIVPSYARHIKDLERSLYDIAVSLGIEFKKEKFVTFEKKAVVTVDEKSEMHATQYDCVFDATGTRRALVKEINRMAGAKPPLEIKSISATENPIKNHFLSNVRISMDDVTLLRKNESEKKVDVVQHTILLERLRSEFGWPHFTEPYFKMISLPQKDKDKDNNTCKCTFYFETPPHLRVDQQEAWFKAVMELKFGKQVDFIPLARHSKKGVEKPRFTPFEVDPKKVDVAAFQGNEEIPMVIPVGDVQFNGDYRRGVSIVEGIQRMNAMFSAMHAAGGAINDFDVESYQTELEDMLEEQEISTGVVYEDIKNELVLAVLREEKNYVAVLDKLNDSTSDFAQANPNLKTRMEDGLSKLRAQARIYCFELKNESIQLLAEIKQTLEDNKSISPNEAVMRKIEFLAEQSLGLKLYLPPDGVNAHVKAIQDHLKELADIYIVLGVGLVPKMANKSKSYHAKIEYYLGHALEIYKKHHPDDKSKQFTIYLNLIKTSMVLRNFDRALEYANQVLAIGPHLRDIPNVDNLMNGVMVNKAHILLTKIEDELQKMTVNLDTVRLLKKEANNTMRGLREDKNTDQAQLEALTRLEAKIDSKLAVLSKHDVDTQDNLFHHTHEPVKAPAEVPAVPGAGVDNSIK